MYYYLYQITNRINGKIYIGIHQTKNMADGYFGSGKRLNQAIEKYGVDNFIIEILEFFNSEKAMVNREIEVVDQDFVDDPNTYNLMPGGKFGSRVRNGFSFASRRHSRSTRKKLSDIKQGKRLSAKQRKRYK